MSQRRIDGAEQLTINRRDVLKASSLGLGVMAFGVPAFSGSALASHVGGHPGSDFSLYGIDHKNTPNRLVKIDATTLEPGNGPFTIQSVNLSTTVDVNTLAAHPFEDGGVRWLYSTHVGTGQAFKVHPDTGQVVTIGSPNPTLKGIAGSAMLVDDGDAHWYGITHGGASPPSTLFEIDLTDGSTTLLGALHLADETPVKATHLGLGVNFLTNELWGVIASDPNDPTQRSQVFKVSDVETGEVEIVDDDAMTGGRSVGAALGPCANLMFVVRNGNHLYGYDVADEVEYEYGTLEYDNSSQTPDFDSLAVPYGSVCEELGYCETSLIAAQHTGVGSVGLLLEDETLHVRYVVDEGYYLAEVHAHVGDDLTDFPGKGKNQSNPAPGQFDYQETFGPGVTEHEFDVDVSGLGEVDEYLVAAHAVVYRTDCDPEGHATSEVTGGDDTLTAAFGDPIYGGGEVTVDGPSEDVTVYAVADGTEYELGTVAAGGSESFDLTGFDVAWFDSVHLVGVVDEVALAVDAVTVTCLVDWEETGWADGCPFNTGKGGNWAMYVAYSYDADTEAWTCGCVDSE